MSDLIQILADFESIPACYSPTQSSYKAEIEDQIKRPLGEYCDIYKELTFIYIRYTGSSTYYKDIDPYLPPDPNDPILYLLSQYRSNLADRISKLYSQVLTQSKLLVSNYCKNGFIISTNFVNLISWLDCRLEENKSLSGFQTSLIEFCEFVASFKKIVKIGRFELEQLEVFFAIFMNFGFNHFYKREEWDKCIEWMRNVFLEYSEDLQRDGDGWGPGCYLVYRAFDGIDHAKRGTLKDVSEVILDGYMRRVERVEKDMQEVKYLIENECFTESLVKTINTISTQLQNFFHITHYLNWKISSPSTKCKSLALVNSFKLLSTSLLLGPAACHNT